MTLLTLVLATVALRGAADLYVLLGREHPVMRPIEVSQTACNTKESLLHYIIR